MKRLFILGSLVGCLGSFPALGGWSQVYNVAVDRTKCGSSNQTNFPVMFHVTDASLKDLAHGGTITSASAYDFVAATDNTIGTYLPFEIELWDNVNGIVWGWVKLSTLNGSSAGSNSTFSLAWGNSAITTQQNTGSYAVSAVYGTNTKVAYNFSSQGGTLALADDTSSAFSLTNTGGTSITGQIDGGVGGFNHSSVFASSHNAAVTSFPYTYDVWAKAASTGLTANADYVLAAQQGGSDFAWAEYFNDGINPNGLRAAVCTSGCGSIQVVRFALHTSMDTNWHHFVFEFVNSTTINAWEDGAALSVNGSSGSGASPSAFTDIVVGAQSASGAGGTSFNGSLDSMRIYNVALSQDWITDEYANQSAPGDIGSANFLIFTSTTVPITFVPQPFIIVVQ